MTDRVLRIVFPARAGMIPHLRVGGFGGAGIPRESGDDPNGFLSYMAANQYSPRERG